MTIRMATPDDAARLLSIYAPYVAHTAVTYEYDVPTPEEFRARIENTLTRFPYLVLEDGGAVRGYCYAGVFKPRAAYSRSCELSIYVEQGEHGKGYGRALYTAMEKELRARGFLNLYACIASPIVEDEYLTRNSERFHAHLGFVTVGTFHKCAYKFGRWYNMIWMEKFAGEHN